MKISSVRNIFRKELGTPIKTIKDNSKGMDHQVFIASTPKGKFVIRIPIKDKNKISLQAWACKHWGQRGVLVPKPIVVRKEYMIETCVPGVDMKHSKLNKLQRNKVYAELGKNLKLMHSIKTKKYGYFVKPGIGKTRNWHDFIGKDFLRNIKHCVDKKKISKSLADDLLKAYKSNENYLKMYKKPRLIHTDLSPDNIMVYKGKLSGIIDAADVLSGDPLYDIGDIYYETADPNTIKHIEKKYGKLNRSLVKFYALIAKVWLLAILKPKDAQKVKQKLVKLLRTRL